MKYLYACIYTLQIIDHLRSCIHDDRVQIEIIETYPQSPIASSDSDSFGYNTVVSSILDVFPDVAVVPGIFVFTSRILVHVQNPNVKAVIFSACSFGHAQFKNGILSTKHDFCHLLVRYPWSENSLYQFRPSARSSKERFVYICNFSLIAFYDVRLSSNWRRAYLKTWLKSLVQHTSSAKQTSANSFLN